MKRTLGILGLLVAICLVTTVFANKSFPSAYNLENVIRRSALFGIISIGAAFVIMTSGIDLSIGSVICLVGCLLPWLLVEQGWSVAMALPAILLLVLTIGLTHGLLVTKMRLQPFVVTLCGLLIYRGITRWLTDDQPQGFRSQFENLKYLTQGRPFSVPVPFLKWISEGNWSPWKWDYRAETFAADEDGGPIAVDFLEWIAVPMPFVIMLALAIVAAVFLNKTIYGRYLLALGRNEEAARYSGINTDRMIILAYVMCAMLAGLGGVLFVLEVNAALPVDFGSFYELYAIAAAVLGGCSLRGGEGTILGVIIGATVMQVLRNSIVLLGIRTQLEFAIIGAVILAGVIADEAVKRIAAKRRAIRQTRDTG